MCRYFTRAGFACDDTDPNTVNDTCSGAMWSVCSGQPDYCGSGIQTPSEQCDDGNAVSGDGCSATCTSERCGDGVVSAPAEVCDDGNGMNGDGCSVTCTVEYGFVCNAWPGQPSVCSPPCGDGICVDPQEVSPGSSFACNEDCSVCGDGRFNVYSERCDESAPDTGCSYSDVCLACAECVPRVSLSSSSSSRAPSANPCGNGTVDTDLGEQCDDGNRNPGDGCDPSCYFEQSVCGDGTRAMNEECDPSETSEDQQTLCADRLIVPREEAYCFSDCTCGWSPPTEEPPQDCGNGEQNDGEECDYGENGYDSAGGGVYCKDDQQGPCCTTSCQFTQCSDGEDNDGDDATDDEDLGCACSDCALAAARDGGEPPSYDPTRDEEQDVCSPPIAHAPRAQGIAWLQGLWASLFAQEEPQDMTAKQCFDEGKFYIVDDVVWKDAEGKERVKQGCKTCQEMPQDQCPAHLSGRTFINAWALNACNEYADTHWGGTREEQHEYCVTSLLCRCDPQAGPIPNTQPDGDKITDLMGGFAEKCYLKCLKDKDWEFPGAKDPALCRARCIMTFCPLASSSSRAASSVRRASSISGGAPTAGAGGASSTVANSTASTAGNTTNTTGTTGGPGGGVSSGQASSVPGGGPSSARSSQGAQSSLRASSRSSVAPSSRSSAPMSTGMACPLNACATANGSAFCNAQNAFCLNTAAQPCFQCVPRGVSSAFSAGSIGSQGSVTSAFACPADSCERGGSQYCAGQGAACRFAPAQPCFTCVALSASSVPAVSSRLAASSVPSVRVTFSLASEPRVSSREAPMSSAMPWVADSPFFSSAALVAVRPTPVDVLSAAAVCGNGVREAGEECDDGNTRDFDGCAAFCLSERGACGDGAVQTLLGEQCEPAAHDPSLPYGCGADCRFRLTTCGNGTLEPGELCDAGAGNSDTPGAFCRTDCDLGRCGDRIVDASSGEQCDDGNRVSGDGCSAACKPERAAPPQLSAQLFTFPTVSPSPVPQAPVQQGWQAMPAVPATAQTGPASIAAMAAGAAAGFAYVRRRRRAQ